MQVSSYPLHKVLYITYVLDGDSSPPAKITRKLIPSKLSYQDTTSVLPIPGWYLECFDPEENLVRFIRLTSIQAVLSV